MSSEVDEWTPLPPALVEAVAVQHDRGDAGGVPAQGVLVPQLLRRSSPVISGVIRSALGATSAAA